MQQIEQIERVLGQEYGRIPKECKSTWKNRYLDYVRQNWYNPVSVLGGALIASVHAGAGFYRGSDHTIWIPNDTTPFSEFAVLHELGHGYTRQRNPKYQEIDDIMAGNGVKSWLGGKFSKARIEELFLSRCVDEGIADYLAIQAQKRAVQDENANPGDVFCYTREWTLVHGEDPKEGEKFIESMPLDKETAKRLEVMGNRPIDFFLSVNETIGLERIKKSLQAVQKLGAYAYVVGHYLVRTTVHDRQEGIGKEVDALVMNPPKSVKELQEIVLSAL